MGVIITTVGSREEYKIALNALQQEGFNVLPGQLSQSFLRTEVVLNRNRSSFTFPIQVNQLNQGTTPGPNTQLLKTQDVFYLTHLSFTINAYTVPGDTPELYRYVPYTYPSEALNATGVVFSKTGYKLWAGTLEFTVNGQVVIAAWDVNRHLYVPETQKQAVNGAFPVSTFYNDHDEFDGAATSFYPVEPNLVLIGNKSTVINLDYPEDLQNAIGESPVEVRAVLTMRGMLAQNASKTA